MANKSNSSLVKEPSVVVKPLGKLGGLDTIHVALIVLVVIMAALLLAISNNGMFAPQTTNQTLTSCPYGIVNSSCFVPHLNQSTAVLAAEKFIASYALLNNSYSLLPYISEVGSANVSYSPNAEQWYVKIPARSPGTNTTFYLVMEVNDKNASVMPFIQTVTPSVLTQNYVQSYGVVRLAQKSQCTISSPVQLYWFVDPYSPGSVRELSDLTAIESQYNATQVSPHLEILFTQSSDAVSQSYGVNNTAALGKYLFCASQQPNFKSFASTLNSSYDNNYMSPGLLSQIASNSELNTTVLGSCLNSSSTPINNQAVLAQYYNVTSTPLVVTDCQYQSIPQTTSKALCLANSKLC